MSVPDKIVIVAMFLTDGEVVVVSNMDSLGKDYEGGDLITLRNKNGEQETAVLLGWGETEEQAESEAKEYIRRVAKWHGDEEVELYGHDLSQYF